MCWRQGNIISTKTLIIGREWPECEMLKSGDYLLTSRVEVEGGDALLVSLEMMDQLRILHCLWSENTGHGLANDPSAMSPFWQAVKCWVDLCWYILCRLLGSEDASTSNSLKQNKKCKFEDFKTLVDPYLLLSRSGSKENHYNLNLFPQQIFQKKSISNFWCLAIKK